MSYPTIDAGSQAPGSTADATGTTLTISVTVASGANRLMTLAVAFASTRTVTVAYGGVALTQAGTVTESSAGIKSELWYLIAPAVGTANLVVTASGATAIWGITTTLNNAKQTSPIGATNSASGNGTTASVNVTTGYPYSIVVDATILGCINANATLGGGQTSLGGVDRFSSAKSEESSLEGSATPATITNSWGLNSAQDWAIFAAEIKSAQFRRIRGRGVSR